MIGSAAASPLSAAPLAATNVNVIFLDIDGVLLPHDALSVDQCSVCLEPNSTRPKFVHANSESTIYPLCLRCARKQIPPTSFSAPGRFPRRCLEALELIVSSSLSSTAVQIVLSSTWRCDGSAVAHILREFEEFGGRLAEITELDHVTDPAAHSVRQHEIMGWFGDPVHRRVPLIGNWIAVDDDSSIADDGKHREEMRGHAVVVDSQRGLTMADARAAARLLNPAEAETTTLPAAAPLPLPPPLPPPLPFSHPDSWAEVFTVPRRPEFNITHANLPYGEMNELTSEKVTATVAAVLPIPADSTGMRVYSGGCSTLLAILLLHVLPQPAPSYFRLPPPPLAVAELGAGLGILSALCTRLLPVTSVLCTDGNAQTLERAKLSSPRGAAPISFEMLGFGARPPPLEGKYGLVVCSELMYYNVNLEALLDTASFLLDRTLAPGAALPPMILMAHVFRVAAYPRKLHELAKERGLVAVSVDPGAFGCVMKDGVVFEEEEKISANAVVNVLVPEEAWKKISESVEEEGGEKWGAAGRLLRGSRLLLDVVMEEEREEADDGFLFNMVLSDDEDE